MLNRQGLLDCIGEAIQGTDYAMQPTPEGARVWGRLREGGPVRTDTTVTVEVALDDAAGTATVTDHVDEVQQGFGGVERNVSAGKAKEFRMTWTPGQGTRKLDSSDLHGRVMGAIERAGWQPVENKSAGTGAMIGLAAALIAAGVLVVGFLVVGVLWLFGA